MRGPLAPRQPCRCLVRNVAVPGHRGGGPARAATVAASSPRPSPQTDWLASVRKPITYRPDVQSHRACCLDDAVAPTSPWSVWRVGGIGDFGAQIRAWPRVLQGAGSGPLPDGGRAACPQQQPALSLLSFCFRDIPVCTSSDQGSESVSRAGTVDASL